MNNEEKVFEILETMQASIADLKQGQADLRAEMNERFDNLEYGLKETLTDVGKVEDKIRKHEREFHGITA